MKRDEILVRLTDIGLAVEDKAVSLKSFSNRCTIMKYGKGRKQLKIVITGKPQENLFGFYVASDTDPIVMKEAYDMYKTLFNHNAELIKGSDIQWGNCDIPSVWGNLRRN